MVKDLEEGLTYTTSAFDLWKAVEHKLGDCNGPLLYRITKEISMFSEENLSVMMYFSKFQKFWDELLLLSLLPNCIYGAGRNCDCNVFKRIMEQEEEDKLIQFLMGLNEDFNHISDQILLMDPIPNIHKAYSMINRTEK